MSVVYVLVSTVCFYFFFLTFCLIIEGLMVTILLVVEMLLGAVYLFSLFLSVDW